MKRFHPFFLGLCGLLAACADRTPLAAPGDDARRFDCTALVREQRITCAPATPAGIRGAILGGQGQYVRITSTNVAFDAGTGTFSADVTVQNLLPTAMGTLDGVNADPAGLRVFFHAGPAVTSGWGTVTVQNADGTGVFTAAGQPYFQYPGILAPGATSAPRTWQFHADPDVAWFAFTVYVSTHTAPTLVISEIMAHPTTASEPAGEWFEVHNRSRDSINLQGWTIASGGDAPHVIASPVVVPSQGYVVLGGSTSTSANGGAPVAYAYSGIDLANGTGDWLALRSPAGFTTDSVDWGAAPAETASPPPTGISMELDSVGSDNLYLSGAGSHWVPSPVTFGTGQNGTPGARRRIPLRATSIAAGLLHTCALDTGGQIWCWGSSQAGRLGIGSATVPVFGIDALVLSPVRVAQPAGVTFTQVVAGSTDNTCALTSTGQAYCWGSSVPTGATLALRTTPSPIPQPGGLAFASLGLMGRSFGCGLDGSGQAWCWGVDDVNGSSGQVFALTTPTLRAMPGPLAQISRVDQAECALTTAGQAYCRHKLTVGGDTLSLVSRPGVTWQWIDTSDRRSCGISTLGQMFCWAPDVRAVEVMDHPVTVRFASLAVSGRNVCGVTTAGEVWCQGPESSTGQLGDGSTAENPVLAPVAAPPGVTFSAVALSRKGLSDSVGQGCALQAVTGQVYCWGRGGYVGDGTQSQRNAPVPIYR
ncbi:MAG TPA: lamin tail domain-containing protein [Longimicrobium sp.]